MGRTEFLTLTIQSEPRLETRKPTTRAKWRSTMSAYRSVLENCLTAADIVRDGDVQQPRWPYFFGSARPSRSETRAALRVLSVIADKLRPKKKNEEARMGTVPLVSLRYCTRKPATYSKPAPSFNAKVPIIPDCVRVSTLAEMSPLPLLVAVPTSLQLL